MLPFDRKLAAALIAAALLLAGCGSSKPSGVSAAAYVKSVCTTATNFNAALNTAGSKIESLAGSKSLTAARSGYVSFITALANATGSASNELAAAGTPSVSGGKAIAQTLVGVFSQAKTQLQSAAAAATRIPTSSKSAFDAATSKVVTDVRDAMSGMSKIAPEQNAQLHTAATKDPTCRSLAAG